MWVGSGETVEQTATDGSTAPITPLYKARFELFLFSHRIDYFEMEAKCRSVRQRYLIPFSDSLTNFVWEFIFWVSHRLSMKNSDRFRFWPDTSQSLNSHDILESQKDKTSVK
jgi:hypothetical protein